MFGIDESLYCTPGTNIILSVNYTGIRIKDLQYSKEVTPCFRARLLLSYFKESIFCF